MFLVRAKLNLFQNTMNRINSLSLFIYLFFFCHSNSNLVSIPVCCLIPFSKYQSLFLAVLEVKCVILAFPPHPFVACDNIRFSSLFAAGDVSYARNVPSDEERGETDVFAG